MKTCETLEVGDWVLYSGYKLAKCQVTRVLKATFEIEGISGKFSRKTGCLRGDFYKRWHYCEPWDEERHAPRLAEQEAEKQRNALLSKLETMAWRRLSTEQMQAVLDFVKAFQ